MWKIKLFSDLQSKNDFSVAVVANVGVDDDLLVGVRLGVDLDTTDVGWNRTQLYFLDLKSKITWIKSLQSQSYNEALE